MGYGGKLELDEAAIWLVITDRSAINYHGIDLVLVFEQITRHTDLTVPIYDR